MIISLPKKSVNFFLIIIFTFIYICSTLTFDASPLTATVSKTSPKN